jgi:N6-adenosine-specific RNA methylase IME4
MSNITIPKPLIIPAPRPPLLRGLRRNHAVTVCVDVPWKYVVRSHKGAGRSPDYKTMTLEEIAALPVIDYVADDSRMLFWITGPFLAIAAHVPIMRAYGYEPTAIWGVWVKPTKRAYGQGDFFRFIDDDSFKMHMGHTSRQNAEFVVEGRRGSPPKRLSKSVRQVIVEPIREHSRKPEKFYRNVVAYSPGPYLELFAREPRKGWVCRGDEKDKFKS